MTAPSQDRLLFLIKSRGPQTASEAAEEIGMTTPGAHQHLTKLATAGLVKSQNRNQGRGRPKQYWDLTDKGHARFPDRHSDLTLDLLKSTETVFGSDGLERLIAHREQETLENYEAALSDCHTLQEKVVALTAVRLREGYMAEVKEHAPGHFTFIENHCPICAAASACQGLCRSELDIFRVVLGPDVKVERSEHILKGARRCTYLISKG